MRCYPIPVDCCICPSCLSPLCPILPLAAVICVWQAIVFIIEACESYLSPLCTYITSECCLQTTLTRLICCVNQHHYGAYEGYTGVYVFFYSSIFVRETKQCSAHSLITIHEVASSFHLLYLKIMPWSWIFVLGQVRHCCCSFQLLLLHKITILALQPKALMLPDLHRDSMCWWLLGDDRGLIYFWIGPVQWGCEWLGTFYILSSFPFSTYCVLSQYKSVVIHTLWQNDIIMMPVELMVETLTWLKA